MYDRKDGRFVVCLIFHGHLRDATKPFWQSRCALSVISE
jgi:hypothetical protein